MKTSFRNFSPSLLKYLFQEVGLGFFLGTGIFLFVLLIFQAIRLSEFVIAQQVPVREVLRLGYYLVQTFVPIVIPISFLFAVLMGISRANSEGELVALQTGGVPLMRLYWPLHIISWILCGVCAYAALFVVPHSQRKFELLITRLSNEKVLATLKPGVFMDGFLGLMLYTEQIIPARNEMKRVFIYDDREGDYPLAITAKRGILRHNPETAGLTLRLTDGTIHVDRKKVDAPQQRIDFDLYDINLDPPEAARTFRDYSLTSQDFTQIRARLATTEPGPEERYQLEAEIHRRFSLAFACVVFSALGFFITLQSPRGLRGTAVLVCLGVAVLYWLCFLGGVALAAVGGLDPWIAVWFPNALVLWFVFYLHRRLTV